VAGPASLFGGQQSYPPGAGACAMRRKRLGDDKGVGGRGRLAVSATPTRRNKGVHVEAKPNPSFRKP
jgi:hypothetical protein